MIINSTNGYNALNFEIVDGTEEQISPIENTIWIHTDTPISCWQFSNGEPSSPVPGMVWIKTIANATCVGQFNAIRKHNCIEVYPQAAYQYIGGAWVGKPAQTRKNGSWVDWDLWVFKSGSGLVGSITGFSNVDCGTDGITGDWSLSDSRDMISNETIDVTAYSTAHFSGVSARSRCGQANTSYLEFFVGDKTKWIGESNVNGDATLCTNEDFAVDISDVVGAVHFGIEATSNGSANFSIEIENIWLQ